MEPRCPSPKVLTLALLEALLQEAALPATQAQRRAAGLADAGLDQLEVRIRILARRLGFGDVEPESVGPRLG